MVIGFKHRLMISTVTLTELRSLGLDTLSSVGTFMVAQQKNRALFDKCETMATFLLAPGEMLYVPFEYIPLVSCVPFDQGGKPDASNKERGCCVVLTAAGSFTGLGTPVETMNDLKQHLDTTFLSNGESSGAWKVVKKSMTAWTASLATAP